MKLPEPARALIESGAHGHLVTLNPDGSPHVTIVWVGLEGDDLVMAHLPENQKVRNIRQDSRVAISFESEKSFPLGEDLTAVRQSQASFGRRLKRFPQRKTITGTKLRSRERNGAR